VIFVDSNVIIDILEKDERWFGWSFPQLSRAVQIDHAVTNLVVFAECAGRFEDVEQQAEAFATLGLSLLEFDEATAYQAGIAHRRYRRTETDRSALLSDFLIGAHAERLGATMLSRDRRIYERYFPALNLISPKDPHG
jgi:predicted nucleic acid-binding protein